MAPGSISSTQQFVIFTNCPAYGGYFAGAGAGVSPRRDRGGAGTYVIWNKRVTPVTRYGGMISGGLRSRWIR